MISAISIPKFDANGKKSGDVKLNTKFKDLKLNSALIKQVIIGYLTNKRITLANTKTRAEVSGGGRKPFRQKGTGSARTGSIRTPIHIGGGIVFGPTKARNFKVKINKNMRTKALAQAIAAKANSNETFQIPEVKLEKFNTKEALSKIAKHSLKEGSILLIIEKADQKIFISYRNIAGLDVKTASGITCYDILNHDNILFSGKSLDIVKNNLN